MRLRKSHQGNIMRIARVYNQLASTAFVRRHLDQVIFVLLLFYSLTMIYIYSRNTSSEMRVAARCCDI